MLRKVIMLHFHTVIPKVAEQDFLDSTTIVQSTGTEFGKGTYGSVREVNYHGNIYAVKVTNFVESFNQKLETFCRIRHPNIVPYYGLCRLAPNNERVIVMEKMEINLNDYLQQTVEMTLDTKLKILSDIILGLRFLHAQQPAIIHTDLTVKNVLLDSKRTAKVSDFGNSCMKKMNHILTHESLTLEDVPLAMDYMPPEALEKGYENCEKLDVFSFGHLSIHVLLQKRPLLLLRRTYNAHGELNIRTEVERREVHINDLKCKLDKHPFYLVMISCLHDEPCRRPPSKDIHGVLISPTHLLYNNYHA